MYDAIIIGGGPAGLSAAIYAARREMKVLLLTEHIGGQMMWASSIKNYPGFMDIPAADLIAKMEEQVRALGVEIKLAEVKKIAKDEDGNFSVSASAEIFKAKTAIAALGAAHRQLGVPGEKELNGRGVAYCANCDGPLFRNKTVAIIGGGNSALDAAEVMSKIAAKVFLINRGSELRAFEALINKVRAQKNVEIILEKKVEEIKGEKKVSSLKISDLKTGEISELAVDGVFVEIGFEVKTELVADLAKLNEKKEIIINEKGETSFSGLFAAGDTTTSPFKQIIVAAGQGAIAALGAYEYIQLKKAESL